MHAEIVAVNVGRERHGLEGLDECVEDGLVATVLTEYFLAKGEVLGHGDGLVVSAEECDLRWKVDFEAEKENANILRNLNDLSYVSPFKKFSDVCKEIYDNLSTLFSVEKNDNLIMNINNFHIF